MRIYIANNNRTNVPMYASVTLWCRRREAVETMQ